MPRPPRPRSVVAATSLVLIAGMSGCARPNPAIRASESPDAHARQVVVEANIGELQTCWSDISADYPDREGSLLFAVEIRRNGRVDWVDIEIDEIGAPRLSACVVKTIKRWHFPADQHRHAIHFDVGFQ